MFLTSFTNWEKGLFTFMCVYLLKKVVKVLNTSGSYLDIKNFIL